MIFCNMLLATGPILFVNFLKRLAASGVRAVSLVKSTNVFFKEIFYLKNVCRTKGPGASTKLLFKVEEVFQRAWRLVRRDAGLSRPSAAGDPEGKPSKRAGKWSRTTKQMRLWLQPHTAHSKN